MELQMRRYILGREVMDADLSLLIEQGGAHRDVEGLRESVLVKLLHGHVFIRSFTSATNWSFRSYSFLNMPKDAKAGEKRMTSPFSARANASSTALLRS